MPTVATVEQQAAAVNGQAPPVFAIPFREATLERANSMAQHNTTLNGVYEPIVRDVPGSGYIYGFLLDVTGTTAGNAATVTFAEDGPYSALGQIRFKDVNSDIISLNDGYELKLVNDAMRQFAVGAPNASNLFFATAGAGATGGSFRFKLRVPVALDRRSLRGLLANQDRAQKFELRTDRNPESLVYGVQPTSDAALRIWPIYENYTVPQDVNQAGVPQEIVPPHYGLIHEITSSISERAPQASSQIEHNLVRVGNTIRFIILVFRSNGSRVTADAGIDHIRFVVGEDTIFDLPYQIYRQYMFDRYGFNWDPGVVVIDAIHDAGPHAGYEIGNDYYHTQAVVNARLIVTYNALWNNTNSSLRIITSDLKMSAGVRRALAQGVAA